MLLNIDAFGAFGGTADLAFGYDTYGIRTALRTGNAADVYDGFFVSDYSLLSSAEKPEFTFSAEVGLAAAINAIVVEAGLSGSLRFDAGIDLQDIAVPKLYVLQDQRGRVANYDQLIREVDSTWTYDGVTYGQVFKGDGKIRGSEIATMFEYNGGGFKNLVNLDASLRLLIKAFVNVGIKIPFVGKVMKRIVDLTLVNAELLRLDYNAPHVQPILGHVDGSGTLHLHTGPNAGSRRYLDAKNGNEKVKLIGDGNSLRVVLNDYVQEFANVRRIVAEGGEGDDVFDATSLFGVTIDIGGGAGSDRIVAGQARPDRNPCRRPPR